MSKPGTSVERTTSRGWDVVRLRSKLLEAVVVPDKGADILSVRWLPLGIDLLWRSPWGLRARGATPIGRDTYTTFMEGYPGGWQTLFPSAGDAAVVEGIEQPFHGEACRVAWDWAPCENGIELSTQFVLSPFHMVKRVTLHDATITVYEAITNTGSDAWTAMWTHHPAFGAPFLEEGCTLQSAAREFIADESFPSSDLVPGSRTQWPNADGKDGSTIDLRRIPKEGAGVSRLGYLTQFDRGWASIENHAKGVRADLEWDADTFPYAWLWLEAGGSRGFPVYKSWYVMAVEPATSYPARGIHAAAKTDSLIAFEAGETRSASVTLTVTHV